MKKSAWRLHGSAQIRCNSPDTTRAETEGHSVSAVETMRQPCHESLTLFGPSGSRKYLNAAERLRFVEAARGAPPQIALFASRSAGPADASRKTPSPERAGSRSPRSGIQRLRPAQARLHMNKGECHKIDHLRPPLAVSRFENEPGTTVKWRGVSAGFPEPAIFSDPCFQSSRRCEP